MEPITWLGRVLSSRGFLLGPALSGRWVGEARGGWIKSLDPGGGFHPRAGHQTALRLNGQLWRERSQRWSWRPRFPGPPRPKQANGGSDGRTDAERGPNGAPCQTSPRYEVPLLLNPRVG